MIETYRTKQNHLQITCSPEQYPLLLEEFSYGKKGIEAIIPSYLISRCPFCGAVHTAPVDTHSLQSWSNSTTSDTGHYFAHHSTLSKRYHDTFGCKHFNRVQAFFNLEGIVPAEVAYFEQVYHIPFVMPFYLPDNQPTAAVIHSLPVCRIESDDGLVYHFDFHRFVPPITEIQLNRKRKYLSYERKSFADISAEDREKLATAHFVPRYTGFAVTYYALHPKQLIEEILPDRMSDHWVCYLASMEEIANIYPEGYRLREWVEIGKLLWLDLDAPDLPLKAGPVEDFPYDTTYFDVTGVLEGLSYRMGLFNWRSLPRR